MGRDAREKGPGRSNTEAIAEAENFPKGTQKGGRKTGALCGVVPQEFGKRKNGRAIALSHQKLKG